jgi:hypothetical protein
VALRDGLNGSSHQQEGRDMHTTAKLSMLLGAGVLTAIVGAGPAQASPAPPPRGQDDVIGYFSNRMDCEWIGRLGDAQNRWDDPDCDQVNFGPYRNTYVLKAERRGSFNWPGQGQGPSQGWPGQNQQGQGQGWPGPGRPGGGHGPGGH